MIRTREQARADAEAEAQEFSELIESSQSDTTGIPAPPTIDISEAILAPNIFDFEPLVEPTAEAFPGGGGLPSCNGCAFREFSGHESIPPRYYLHRVAFDNHEQHVGACDYVANYTTTDDLSSCECGGFIDPNDEPLDESCEPCVDCLGGPACNTSCGWLDCVDRFVDGLGTPGGLCGFCGGCGPAITFIITATTWNYFGDCGDESLFGSITLSNECTA